MDEDTTTKKNSPPGQDIFCTPENAQFLATKPYTDLDPTIHEIRLLKIDPNSVDGPGLISCELLQNQPLAEWKNKYTTISYCAGSALNTAKVLVDGAEFNVFANLHHCLTLVCNFWKTTYGDSGKDLYLWADQICINQFDLKERSHQVTFMRDIYGTAEQVLVCLSEPTTVFDDDFLSWIRDIESNVPYVPDTNWQDASYSADWLKHWFLPGLKLENHLPSARRTTGFLDYERLVNYVVHNIDTTNFETGWYCFLSIIQSRWWGRSWVLQEFLIPEQVHLMHCNHALCWKRWGRLLSSLLEFKRASSLNQNGSFHPNPPKAASSINLREYFPRNMKLDYQREDQARTMLQRKHLWGGVRANDLKKLLTKSYHFEASDARDLVYAFLGLAPSHGIIPDYSPQNSLSQVLTETTRKIIEGEESLAILEYAALKNWTASEPSDCYQLPSWVFDCITRPRLHFSDLDHDLILQETKGRRPRAGLSSATVQFGTYENRPQQATTALSVCGLKLGSLLELVTTEQSFNLESSTTSMVPRAIWARYSSMRYDNWSAATLLENPTVRLNISDFARHIHMEDELWILDGSAVPLLLRPVVSDNDLFVLVAGSRLRDREGFGDGSPPPQTVRLLGPDRDYVKELRHITII